MDILKVNFESGGYVKEMEMNSLNFNIEKF